MNKIRKLFNSRIETNFFLCASAALREIKPPAKPPRRKENR
jgi:hypothetical protein